MSAVSPVKEQSSTSRPHYKMSGSQVVLQSTLTETEFRKMVLDEAEKNGWHHRFFIPNSKTGKVSGSSRGFPDLLLTKGHLLVFAELKTEEGEASPEQLSWLTALSVVSEHNQSVGTYLWRPSDWWEIQEVLERAA